MNKHPNLLFVFADQWRQQAFGYTGDPNARTPNIDRLAGDSINCMGAVSGCPVCTPYRASLMTGVYPHRHHLMVNDQCLIERYPGPFLGECLREGGYQTAYIGKWHLDGHGRQACVPPGRRLGFDGWQGFECCHDYRQSYYYAGSDPRPHRWPGGFDADAQTDEACRFLRGGRDGRPFALVLSWGPPHNPFGAAPESFARLFDPATIQLAPNVPPEQAERARQELAGYYAYGAALDAALGRLLATLAATGLDRNTIVVFTSDHGDMLGSQGLFRKQKPWAESIRVPLLVRIPGVAPRRERAPVDAPDLMPTLLALCGLAVPGSVQGRDFSRTLLHGEPSGIDAALLALYVPFHEWSYDNGGRELRGLYTGDWTYVRTLEGPWLLYDNQQDPAQQHNLIHEPSRAGQVAELDARLTARLHEVGDDFAPGRDIIRREAYRLNEHGDIAYDRGALPEPWPDAP